MKLMKGLGIQAVAFFQAMGDVEGDLRTGQLEQVPEDGDAGDAVHIIVAVQHDGLSLPDLLSTMMPAASTAPGSSSGVCSERISGLRKARMASGSVMSRLWSNWATSGEMPRRRATLCRAAHVGR